MTSIHPPRMATWLLRRFSSGPHAEAIAGDLLEQYQSIRSPLWYWGQVGSAVAADVRGSVASAKLQTAGALALGCIAYVALSVPATTLERTWRRPTLRWLVDAPDTTTFWAMKIESALIVYLACAISGWLVARVTRSAAGVMVFALTVLVFEYGMMALLWTTAPRPADASFSIPIAVLTFGRPLSVLVGGLLAVREPGRSATAV